MLVAILKSDEKDSRRQIIAGDMLQHSQPRRLRSQPHCAAWVEFVRLGLVWLCVTMSVLSASDAAKVERDIRLRLQPTKVFAAAQAELTLVTDPPLARGYTVEWSSQAGRLLFDDGPATTWRAPEAPGTYRIVARITSGTQSWTHTDSVTVHRPSTAGMIWIPAGAFVQGDIVGTLNAAETKTVQNAGDEPYHRVHLSGFWIDRHPVTHAQYAEFLASALNEGLVRIEDVGVFGKLDSNWVPFYYFKTYETLVNRQLRGVNPRKPEFLHAISWNAEEKRFVVEQSFASAPIVDVSWFGAEAYARYHGKRLPSEAQWEKAARGDDGRKYPWGDNAPTRYHANVNFEHGYEPLAVATFSPYGDSPYGLTDALAGLSEWVADWYNPTYYDDYASSRELRDPAGPFWGKAHTIRGAPYALFYPGFTQEGAEAVSFRYNWHFEFFMIDSFANNATTFRTVVDPATRELKFEDPF